MAPRGFPLGNPFGKMAAGAGQVPQFDPAALNAALQPYGVQLPTTSAPVGPFEAMRAMAGHPSLATGLDNALIAMAGMGPTGATAGENASNVARGVLGIGPYRRQAAAQQFEAPLQIASQVGGLQAQQAMMKMYQGMGEYYKNTGEARDVAAQAQADRAQAYSDLNDMRYQIARMNDAMKSTLSLGHDALGRPLVYSRQWNQSKGDWDDVPRPELDTAPLLRQQHATRFGGGGQGDFIAMGLAAKYGGADKIPTEDTPELFSNYQKLLSQYQAYTKIAPAVGAAAGKDVLPPSISDQWNKAKAGWQTEVKGMLYNQMPKNKLDDITDPQVAALVAKGVPWEQARGQVQQLLNAHDAQLSGLYGEFNKMRPTDQMAYGTFGQFAQSRGYDPTTRTFQPQQNAQPQGGGRGTPQPQIPQGWNP